MERINSSINYHRPPQSSFVPLQSRNSSDNIESPRSISNNNNNNGVEIEKHLPTTTDEKLGIPIVQLTRIMGRVLPLDAKIGYDATKSMQLCVSEFTNTIMREANKLCKADHRMIITVDDLLGAMNILRFENYIEPLCNYRDKYRKRNSLGACGGSSDSGQR